MSKKYYCNNCGNYGHTGNYCSFPHTSYGIILYKKYKNNDNEYLLVRRKHTYGYLGFLRGLYGRYEIGKLNALFKEMTKDELIKLETMDFQQLWDDLWVEKTVKKPFLNDKHNPYYKFCELKEGYLINDSLISLDLLITKFKVTSWEEQEWGFPKGTRENKETDLTTSLREFHEETNIDLGKINIVHIPPITETFIGSDNVRYRHIYYVAELKDEVELEIITTEQQKELSDIRFMTIEECIERIRPYNQEKIDILRQLERVLS